MASTSTAALLKTACRACLRAEGRLRAASERAGGLPALHGAWSLSVRAELRGALANGRMSLAVDMALRYLQLLNQRAAAVASSDYTPKPAEVAYAVGQVLRECGSGVRVAVAGYDLSSAREGAEEFDVALGAQPHYHVLADVRDLAATGAVGSTLPLGARAASQTAYLPQTALVPLTTSACDDDGFVLHPLLATYFTEFNCATGAFVPAGPVAALYADDAFAAAAAAGLAPTSRVAASAAAVRTGTSVRALLAALEERAAAVHRATAAGAARATVDDDGDRAAASDDDDDEPEEDADAAAARGAKWGRS